MRYAEIHFYCNFLPLHANFVFIFFLMIKEEENELTNKKKQTNKQTNKQKKKKEMWLNVNLKSYAPEKLRHSSLFQVGPNPNRIISVGWKMTRFQPHKAWPRGAIQIYRCTRLNKKTKQNKTKKTRKRGSFLSTCKICFVFKGLEMLFFTKKLEKGLFF